MVSPLVGLHVAISELGILMFIWAFIEIFAGSNGSAKRARTAVLLGTIIFFLSWFTGGYYYVNTYGPEVKPVIKAGPQPWAHGVVMEAKEHIFLILPILALATLFFVGEYGKDALKKKDTRKGLLILIGLNIAIGILMAVFGYFISSGFRSALEAAA